MKDFFQALFTAFTLANQSYAGKRKSGVKSAARAGDSGQCAQLRTLHQA
jgi:hypothetical protein